jgi:hypothetical protein
MASVGVIGGKGEPSLPYGGFDGHFIGLCQFFDPFVKVNYAHRPIIGKKCCFFAKKVIDFIAIKR